MTSTEKLANIAEEDFVTVSGAGLAGCMTALLLARRGYYVRLLESREDFRIVETKDTEQGRFANAAKRSINLSLATRGKSALKRAGLYKELKAKHLIAMPSRTIHTHGPTGLPYVTQPYGIHDGQCLYSVSREFINQHLLSIAEKHPNITIQFEARVMMVFKDGSCDVSISNGPLKRIKSKFVIGADGAYSNVRNSVVRMSRGEVRRLFLDLGYKEILIPPKPDGTPYMPEHWHSLHVWPSGQNFMVAMPNPDNSWTCTMVAKFKLDGLGLDEVKTEEKAQEFFETFFPDIIPMVPDLAAQFLRNPSSPLMSVWMSPFHFEDKALVLGDAAHAVTPFFGQGMNSSFEDACLLDELMDEFNDDIGKAFAEFSKRRVKSAHALTDLCIAHAKELGDETGSAYWLFKRALGRTLHRVMPKMWVPFMTMVAFSRVPYDEAVRLKAQQEKILDVGLFMMLVASIIGVGAGIKYLPSKM